MSSIESAPAVTEELELEAAVRDTARVGVSAMGLRLASYAIGFVASVMIARSLGPTGRGLYALPLAVLGIVMALAPLGLEHANFALAAKGVRARVLWANGTLAAAGISVAVALVLVAIVALVPASNGELPTTWYVVVLAQVPLLLLTLYWASVLQLEHRYVTVSLGFLAAVGLHAAVVAAMFFADALTPFRVLALTWVVNGSALIWIYVVGARAGAVGWRPDVRTLRAGLAFGLKVHGGAIAFFLLLRLDQVLVQGLVGFRALGLYSLAVTIGELLWLLCEPLAIAVLPHQARVEGDNDRRLAFATARLALLFALVGGTVLWVASPWLIGFVYGRAFDDAASLLRWLLPGIVALSAARPLSTLLLRDGRPLLLSALGLLTLIANVGLNLVLLPSIGTVGASVASSIAYVALLVAYVGVTRRKGIVGWRELVPRPGDLTRLRPNRTTAIDPPVAGGVR